MKSIKSLVALAVMASLALNSLNAHAFALNEVAGGVTVDASSTISVMILTAGQAPATQIAVSFLTPQINADGTLDRSRVAMVDVPALPLFSRYLARTPLQGHNCWLYVVTDIDKSNQIKAFRVY